MRRLCSLSVAGLYVLTRQCDPRPEISSFIFKMATKHDYHEDHRHGHSNNPRSGKRGGRRKRHDSDEQGYDHHHGYQSYRHDGEHRRGNARKLNRGNFEQGHDTRQQDGRRSGGGWRRHDDRFNVEYTDTTQGEPYERQNRPKSGGHHNDHHFNSRGGHRAHQGGGQHGHQGNRDFEESHHGRSHHRGGRGQGGSGLDRKQFKRPFKVIDGESPLNPYHSCSFTIGGNDYISVAQYVIYQKAAFHKYSDEMKEILATDEPDKLRGLDHRVSKHLDKEWLKWRHKELLSQGNNAKFSQHEDLQEALFATENTTLVLAMPDERHWGIGLPSNSPLADDRQHWRGSNIFGYVLSDVRDRLMASKKFTFFFGHEFPFSQHHRCKITLEGLEYSSAEQYMMHQKAVTFEDDNMASDIMNTDDPKKQKALGRKVSNFDPEVWDKISRDVVKKANLAKFSQNPDLKKALFDTGTTKLVEASPFDKLWGIGLRAEDPQAWNESTWRGRNQLGDILTEVRETLRETETNKSTTS